VTLNNRYEFQMQYGSIGWSVGATLGYAQAAKDKRVIACIGDGSFQVRIHRNCPRCSASFFRHGVPVCSRSAWHWQVTAQDVSTMLRCGQRSVIFLINNGGYTIEVEIHDGPYNVVKNWEGGTTRAWSTTPSTTRTAAAGPTRSGRRGSSRRRSQG